jgi:hypothetical protein
MQQPTPSHSTIVAVTTADDSHAAVRKRAAALGHQIGSSVILWARDASISPLESPLPTDWSGEGEQEEFGDRLGPNDLMAAGREPIARQVGELRKDGVDAWAWLPASNDAESLASYATDHGASLILVSTSDSDLIEDLRKADERGSDGHRGGLQGLRVEAVPG